MLNFDIVRFHHLIEQTQKILNLSIPGHPIKKHFLVKNLPTPMKRQLLHGRKYIFSIYEDIQKLAYMGLVQMGVNVTKEKDQAFIYINQKARLFDTRDSAQGYHQIEVTKNTFCRV